MRRYDAAGTAGGSGGATSAARQSPAASTKRNARRRTTCPPQPCESRLPADDESRIGDARAAQAVGRAVVLRDVVERPDAHAMERVALVRHDEHVVEAVVAQPLDEARRVIGLGERADLNEELAHARRVRIRA